MQDADVTTDGTILRWPFLQCLIAVTSPTTNGPSSPFLPKLARRKDRRGRPRRENRAVLNGIPRRGVELIAPHGGLGRSGRKTSPAASLPTAVDDRATVRLVPELSTARREL
jgi:hypothetical protein